MHIHSHADADITDKVHIHALGLSVCRALKDWWWVGLKKQIIQHQLTRKLKNWCNFKSLSGFLWACGVFSVPQSHPWQKKIVSTCILCVSLSTWAFYSSNNYLLLLFKVQPYVKHTAPDPWHIVFLKTGILLFVFVIYRVLFLFK